MSALDRDSLGKMMLLSNIRSIDKKIPLYLILTLAVLLPATFALYLAINSGEISTHDYWGIMMQYLTVDGFSHRPADWLQSQNGHILLIPKVIYAVNIVFTQGSNISLSLIAWLFALLQTALLIQLLPYSIQDWRVIVVLAFSISAFSFTPSAVHSWTLGFSGVHWIGANLFAIASIASLTYYFRTEQLAWIFGSLLSATAATFTYGTSLALWPALCIGTLLILPRLRLSLIYIGLTIVVYAQYLSRFGAQSDQSIPSYGSISALILYATTYLGAIFTENNALASLIGAIGALLSMLIAGHLFFRSTSKARLYLLPWFLIQVYTVENAVITALSRSHLGVEQAMVSRYASLPGLFWVSLIVTVMYYLCQPGSNWSWYKFAPAFAVIGILIMAMYPLGFGRAKEFLHRVSLQPLAILSINLGIPDDVAITHSITISPGQFLTMIPILQAHKHIPFNKQNYSCPQFGQIIPQDFLTQTSQGNVGGLFDFMDRFTEDGARVVGWAYSENRDIKCIVLLNEENFIRGIAFSGFYRPDVAETLTITDQMTGWMGYVRVSSNNENLTAYALLSGDNHWFALESSHSLEEPGQVDYLMYTAMILPPP